MMDLLTRPCRCLAASWLPCRCALVLFGSFLQPPIGWKGDDNNGHQRETVSGNAEEQ